MKDEAKVRQNYMFIYQWENIFREILHMYLINVIRVLKLILFV